MSVRVRRSFQEVKTRAASGTSGAPTPLPHPGVLNDNKDVIAAVKFEAIKLDKLEAIKKVSKPIEQKF